MSFYPLESFIWKSLSLILILSIKEALDCAILGDGTPPAPILFKRDPNVAEEDKNFDDGKYEELMESDSEEDARSDDGDGASNYSSLEESSTAGSSGMPY